MIFPKFYQQEKSQPKQRRVFSFTRPWPWAYFLNGPNIAASVAPTLIRHGSLLLFSASTSTNPRRFVTNVRYLRWPQEFYTFPEILKPKHISNGRRLHVENVFGGCICVVEYLNMLCCKFTSESVSERI